jgi:hypothetical protein
MRRLLTLLLLTQLALPAAFGWGAHMHRTLSYLALDGLPTDAPEWLRDPAVRGRIAFESNQPDHWRSWNSPVLRHENEPEHYLDVELLAQFDLNLESLPRLRNEYLRALVIAKHTHPDKVDPYDPDKDPARTHEWPGFLPYAIAEHYARLQAAFNQVRILEQLHDPARREQLAEARAIAVYHAGQLSHFVADVAQPLHTTKHYNGWVGDNPAGYKWRGKFHLYIDDGFAEKHGIGYESLKPVVKLDARINAADPWDDVLRYVQRSFAQVEPLYALERDGKLDGDEGRKLIVGRLSDAAALVSAMISAAYTSSAPTEEQVKSWVKYDAPDAERRPPDSAPATTPAPRRD